MANTSRRVGRPRLGEAIKAYRAKYEDQLDGPARQVLKRLEGSERARKAFARLGWLKTADGRTCTFPDEGRTEPDAAMAIIKACIEAQQLAGTCPQRIEEQKHE